MSVQISWARDTPLLHPIVARSWKIEEIEDMQMLMQIGSVSRQNCPELRGTNTWLTGLTTSMKVRVEMSVSFSSCYDMDRWISFKNRDPWPLVESQIFIFISTKLYNVRLDNTKNITSIIESVERFHVSVWQLFPTSSFSLNLSRKTGQAGI